ncbi:MAG: Fic family protein, partial [Desulfovibrionaceae bacterium]|nr:Fic family protein [Desulfovibrionaceae bacterium]
MNWIHELPDWPNFYFNLTDEDYQNISKVRLKQGILIGKLATLGIEITTKVKLEACALEILDSSKIEGEILSEEDVRKSLASRLGLSIEYANSKKIDNLSEIMLDSINPYKILDQERLFSWHAALFPSGYSSFRQIKVGQWRDVTMRVVSGAFGKEKIHYEAPKPERLNFEMKRFFAWLDTTKEEQIIRSGKAHLWFVLIHPFEDGNGRIARNLTDAILSISDVYTPHFYSLSNQYIRNREQYYNLIELAARGCFDITNWLRFHILMYSKAIDYADQVIKDVMFKSKFWGYLKTLNLNPRQAKILNKLLNNFEGKLTLEKYQKITKCPINEAKNDLNYLVKHNILKLVNSDNKINYVIDKNSFFNSDSKEQDYINECKTNPLYIADIPLRDQTEEIVRAALMACQISPGINPKDLNNYIRYDLRSILNDY